MADDRLPDGQEHHYAGGVPPTSHTDVRQAQPTSGRHRQAPVASGDPEVAAPPSGTSGMAVTSFVLGLLGLVGISAILGIVLGFVALRSVRGTLQRGKGLAIAGIVLGSVWLAVAVALIATGTILGTAPPTQPSASGSGHVSGQRVDPFSLSVGDCFNNPTVTPGHVTDVGSVVQKSCTQPHNAQIFATFTASGSIHQYPGSTKLTSIASSGCNARAKASLDSSKITNSMQIRLLFPLESSWVAGHRGISCIIYSPASNMTSSVLNG